MIVKMKLRTHSDNYMARTKQTARKNINVRRLIDATARAVPQNVNVNPQPQQYHQHLAPQLQHQPSSEVNHNQQATQSTEESNIHKKLEDRGDLHSPTNPTMHDEISHFEMRHSPTKDIRTHIDSAQNSMPFGSEYMPPSALLTSEEIEAQLQHLYVLLKTGFIQEVEFEKRKMELIQLQPFALSNQTTQLLQKPVVELSDSLSSPQLIVSTGSTARKSSRNVRIFVSSTFVDMSDEREQLIKKVIPKLQKLGRERGVFVTAVDLRWGITTEQTSEDLVVKDLTEIIERDFPVQKAPTPLEIEKLAHQGFEESRARVYVGRQHYFETINSHLISSPSQPIVVGESGMGKTVRYQNDFPDALVIAHYIGATAASSDLGHMLRRIISEIVSFYKIEKEIPNDTREIIDKFSEFLSEAGARGGVTLVLDALNQLDPRNNSHDLKWLPHVLPPGVRVVLSTLPGRCLDVIKERGWKTMRIVPLSEEERELLTLNDLAVLYARLNRLSEAEEIYVQVLKTRESVLGANHPDTAQSMKNLASLYQDQKRYAEALPLFQRALEITQTSLGMNHPSVASACSALAGVYNALQRYDEALHLYQRAIKIYESLAEGRPELDFALTLNDMAVLYFNQKDYAKSEEHYIRSLSIYERVFGPNHPDVAQALLNLGYFYKSRNNIQQAKAYLQRAVDVFIHTLGVADEKNPTSTIPFETMRQFVLIRLFV